MTESVHSAVSDLPVETGHPGSPWVVMKFGGTSVVTAERWHTIASLIKERLADGDRVLMVHSALAGVSDLLEALISAAVRGEQAEVLEQIESRHRVLATDLEVSEDGFREILGELEQLAAGARLVGEVSPRVQARMMATGELMATAIGAEFLQKVGVPVSPMDARDLLTSRSPGSSSERAQFLSAVCESGPDEQLARRLENEQALVITQGFVAKNVQGETVLLGRGGSDTSAAYLAAKLCAKRLEIWTDVPGMFSADPRAVPTARLLRRLHYYEAQEIASAGGGVLHPRCLPPVRRQSIPLFLRCTAHPEWEGTVVSAGAEDDMAQLKAISSRSGITLVVLESLEMWQQVGFMADAFTCFARQGLSVDLVSTSESNVTVSIDTADQVVDSAAMDALVEDLSKLCRVRVIEDCAAVTLVGRKVRAILHELGPALAVFEEQKVHLVSQAANDLNLTFVVDSEHAHRLVKRMHGLLINRFRQGEVFGSTWEQLVAPGSTRFQTAPPWWARERDALLDVVQEEECAYVYSRPAIHSAIEALKGIDAADAIFYAMKANSHPDIIRLMIESGVNIECVSPAEIERTLSIDPGLDRRRILFTPNFAPKEEYRWGFEQGVWVTLDNLHPIRDWPEIFAGQEVIVRTDPGKGRGHHEHVKTAGVHSKFGVPRFELEELADRAAKVGAKIVGLHAHTGSGILDPENWREVGSQLIEMARIFPDVRYLDLGGGLGVPEKPGQRPLDTQAVNAALGEFKAAYPEYSLWLEPGRFLVSTAGVLLARVTQTKGKGDVQYVGINTGMNSLIRPALYGAYHEIVNLTRLEEPAEEVVNIVGPICETGDRLGSDRLLPATREGDVILIANTGAYGYVMASRYNLREPATEVMIG